LCLGLACQDRKTTRIIVSGDTCDCIVAAIGIRSKPLFATNPNTNGACSNIHSGE
ncbi:hypothetical protein BU15DRAFT_9066, partial [Melanogaster broomeanus]